MAEPPRLPCRAGAGFKPAHFQEIIAGPPATSFFEVHAENYMGAGGPPHAQLGRLREDYPLSVHGVGLSIGSSQPLDLDHLNRLKYLCDRYEPESVSEHLAWSTLGGVYFGDLLPLPYTEETLACVVEHLDKTQNALRREILLENPATYMTFEGGSIAETDFLSEVAHRAGCFLLLDVNNVYVSSVNRGFDASGYLASFPLERIREIHLAGHARAADEAGSALLIDAHDRSIADDVWRLFEQVIARTGPLPTLIEWDNNVPEWPRLLREAQTAQAVLDGAARAAVA